MQAIKKFKDLPWKGPTYDDPWYAGYDAPEPRLPGHRIYVPKDTSLGSIAAAFTAAYKVGETRVGLKEWPGFTVSMDIGETAGQSVGWPYINLFPVFEKKEDTDV
jgi:hypothetical protein